jgi:aquaporin Z
MNKYGAEFFGTFWLVPGRIPVTIASVHPARSTGFGVFVGDRAVAQLWFFWMAPMAGGLLGAAIYRFIGSTEG